MRKGLWSPDEDERLVRCITKYVHGSWSDIARKAGLDRCGKSCRRRWMNHLRPDLKRGKFSVDEINVIVQLQETLGNRWSDIASHLEGRTDNDVKNLWNTQIKKRLSQLKAQIADSSPALLLSNNDALKLNSHSTCSNNISDRPVEMDDSLRIVDSSANSDPVLLEFGSNALAGMLNCSMKADSCDDIYRGETDCVNENSSSYSEPISNLSWQSHDETIRMPNWDNNNQCANLPLVHGCEFGATDELPAENYVQNSLANSIQRTGADTIAEECSSQQRAKVTDWPTPVADYQKRHPKILENVTLPSAVQTTESCHFTSTPHANGCTDASMTPVPLVSKEMQDTISVNGSTLSYRPEARALETFLIRRTNGDVHDSEQMFLPNDWYSVSDGNQGISNRGPTFTDVDRRNLLLHNGTDRVLSTYLPMLDNTVSETSVMNTGVANISFQCTDHVVQQELLSWDNALPNDPAAGTVGSRQQQNIIDCILGWECSYPCNGITEVCSGSEEAISLLTYMPDYSMYWYRPPVQAGD